MTNVINLPSFLGTLESDAQHDLGLHDFYRYGLWGYCEGYNDTVTRCTPPRPGNATNPLAVINAEIQSNHHIPLPGDVEADMQKLQSVSLFMLTCWFIGTILGFITLLSGLAFGHRSRVSTCMVQILALVNSSGYQI